MSQNTAEAVATLEATVEHHEKEIEKHGARLSTLEKFMWLSLGGLLVLSSSAGGAWVKAALK